MIGSDGFFDKLENEDITVPVQKMKNNKQAMKLCTSLLQTMMDRGATDNISCVLLMKRKKGFFDPARKSALVYCPEDQSDEDMISMHDSDTLC